MNTSIVRTQKILRTRIEEVRPFLEVDEPFTVKDVEDETERAYDVLKAMHEHGAIVKVDTMQDRGHYIGKWEWKEQEKADLQEWLENESMFPCGHRATIHDPPWADELACKTCQTEYTKDEVKQYL